MQTVYDVEVFKKMNMAGFINFSGKAFYIVNASNLPAEKIDSKYGTIFINKYPTKPIYDKLNGIIAFNNHNYDAFHATVDSHCVIITSQSCARQAGKRPQRPNFRRGTFARSKTATLQHHHHRLHRSMDAPRHVSRYAASNRSHLLNFIGADN